jgi:hypothetical protein
VERVTGFLHSESLECPEVINIDQDPLGKQGTIVKKEDEGFYLEKVP